ncbi:monodechloroaminopyrrolnitrin synthase PrnB family protein [Allokutzneria albata]|uniref:Monodechloroaminopyrrolnitrin synthase PrnB n=1 Tax=Allokutzneria albata TaxID=211114 RepID=A0A1G9Y6N9_ALLAB|nr:monodechloroaminopyrrolnitrin synthase PrnB family protein [Allokutzneria albata]SDN04727.1 protein of unknown function [Allokutzneria albata]
MRRLATRSLPVRGLDDDRVAALDPLGMDEMLRDLWRMNATGDLRGLIGMLSDLVRLARETADRPLPESLAVMRDLGILLGSVKRHGAEPTKVVPGLEDVLLDLGGRTGMVPRDTIHHYITWNPTGHRERTYTGDRMETMLLSSVRFSLPQLSAAVDVCRRLTSTDLGSLDFVLAANELVSRLRPLEDALDTVTANVTPEFFARTLRPYYEEIRVDGARYLGPAAAHVPLAMVDLLLWASDHGDAAYEEFWRESAQYGLPGWPELTEKWAASPSLVTQLKTAAVFMPRGDFAQNLRASAEALARALHALVVFRAKHLAIARQAYAEENRLYELGSGGGTVQMLEQVIAFTRENATMVRSAFVGGRGRRRSARPARVRNR